MYYWKYYWNWNIWNSYFNTNKKGEALPKLWPNQNHSVTQKWVVTQQLRNTAQKHCVMWQQQKKIHSVLVLIECRWSWAGLKGNAGNANPASETQTGRSSACSTVNFLWGWATQQDGSLSDVSGREHGVRHVTKRHQRKRLTVTDDGGQQLLAEIWKDSSQMGRRSATRVALHASANPATASAGGLGTRNLQMMGGGLHVLNCTTMWKDVKSDRTLCSNHRGKCGSAGIWVNGSQGDGFNWNESQRAGGAN